MKTWLSALILIFSFTAEALPNVGDYIRFKGYETIDGKEIEKNIELTILEARRSDQSYLVETVTTEIVSKAQDRKQEWMDVSDLDPTNTLANCERIKGARESVTTLAGVFDTCHVLMTNEKGQQPDVWIGKVPLGIVKWQLKLKGQGTPIKFTVRDFKWGQRNSF